jgi:hypothetical protein
LNALSDANGYIVIHTNIGDVKEETHTIGRQIATFIIADHDTSSQLKMNTGRTIVLHPVKSGTIYALHDTSVSCEHFGNDKQIHIHPYDVKTLAGDVQKRANVIEPWFELNGVIHFHVNVSLIDNADDIFQIFIVNSSLTDAVSFMPIDLFDMRTPIDTSKNCKARSITNVSKNKMAEHLQIFDFSRSYEGQLIRKMMVGTDSIFSPEFKNHWRDSDFNAIKKITKTVSAGSEMKFSNDKRIIIMIHGMSIDELISDCKKNIEPFMIQLHDMIHAYHRFAASHNEREKLRAVIMVRGREHVAGLDTQVAIDRMYRITTSFLKYLKTICAPYDIQTCIMISDSIRPEFMPPLSTYTETINTSITSTGHTDPVFTACKLSRYNRTKNPNPEHKIPIAVNLSPMCDTVKYACECINLAFVSLYTSTLASMLEYPVSYNNESEFRKRITECVELKADNNKSDYARVIHIRLDMSRIESIAAFMCASDDTNVNSNVIDPVKSLLVEMAKRNFSTIIILDTRHYVNDINDPFKGKHLLSETIASRVYDRLTVDNIPYLNSRIFIVTDNATLNFALKACSHTLKMMQDPIGFM